MNVTQITGDGFKTVEIPSPSDDDMQNEYNYIFAGELTKRLLAKGLITEEEFAKIMEKNRRSFSPLISKIMPK